MTGRRIAVGEGAYRAGHVLGNRLLSGLTTFLFDVHVADLLSGYRVMSRRFVKSFPFTAEGFGIETELTVHAVRLLMPMLEMDTHYKERAKGSASKLNTWRDGFRILFTIVGLMREERPLIFFAASVCGTGGGIADPGHAGCALLPEISRGAAVADGDPVHGTDAAGVPVACKRHDFGHGDARALGTEAAGLSRHSRTAGYRPAMSGTTLAKLSGSRFVRFAAVGVAGYFVDAGALAAFLAIGLDKYSGQAIAFLIAATFTWWGNRKLTFPDLAARGCPGLLREWASFLAANAVGGIANYATYAALVTSAPPPASNPYAAVAAGIAGGVAVQFHAVQAAGVPRVGYSLVGFTRFARLSWPVNAGHPVGL